MNGVEVFEENARRYDDRFDENRNRFSREDGNKVTVF